MRLVPDEGKSIAQVARDLDLPASSLSLWVRHARADRSKGKTGPWRLALGVSRLEGVPAVGACAARRSAPRPGSCRTRGVGQRDYGSPRMHRELRDSGTRVSRERVSRPMQEEGLVARIRRRYECTTVSDPTQPIAPNLLKQDFEAAAPNPRWVGDTTELLIGPSRSKLFLATIVDLYSRFVVGWALSARNDRHLVIRALDTALRRRRPGGGLVYHSDQGGPYAGEDQQKILAAHGISRGLSPRGNCYDNAAMECFYNPTRRHSALDYLSPAQYERAARCRLAA
ncbi:MAG: IS3 family transposase [Deltaproteobacteria bacterium]|nr:IS3 family transposase [Deltaproteobacteria bacterium]